MANRTVSRRNFLRTAPIAAAAGVTLTNSLLITPDAEAQAAPAVPFQFFSTQTLADDLKASQAKPGDTPLFNAKSLPVNIVMTTEVAKSAKEFEWHEGRDHIVQILDGSTLYEVGGTPKNGRTTKPGEWLAPAADGSKSILMAKGDMLVIPRGTLHKRSTEDSVTFLLISSPGVIPA